MHHFSQQARQFFLLLLMLISLLTPARAEQPSSDQILILDASGSMWGQIDGTNKVVIARDVLGRLIQKLSDDVQVGLVAYGHRRKGDCDDIETLTAVAPIDKATLITTINDLNPKGKTPISDSIKQAIGLVRNSEQPTNIILVSDGLETCGGDPCKVVSDAKAAGVKFVMHVVGFGIEANKNVASLECAAQAGDGLYFDANSADELSAALEQAVEKPPLVTGGFLSIKAVANGDLSDVAIQITDAASGDDVASGRTYRSDQTNPRKLLLPAGRYKATIRALEFSGSNIRKLDDIVIVEDETVEHRFDFSSGKISIKVVRNGRLSDAGVRITPVGEKKSAEKKPVASGRTYTSEAQNPSVSALNQAKPVTSKIGVINAETGKWIAQARSRSKPTEFHLPPGNYRVKSTALKTKNSIPQEQRITLEVGKTAELVMDFALTKGE
ncbi:MAG: VWA domain-containing protein [Pseudomonadales bacterium]|nr:VWA domain-containing protein [Pseudomonadales bacterium]